MGKDEKVESVWMTDQIRRGMKMRRMYSRMRRNSNREEERARLWKKYMQQKLKIQKWIREAMERNEETMVKNIMQKMKEGKGGKMLWECIKKLLGKDRTMEEVLEVYNAQCAQMAILWKKLFLNDSKSKVAIKIVLYIQNFTENHLKHV